MSKVSIERMTKIVRFIRKRGSVPMKFLVDEFQVFQACKPTRWQRAGVCSTLG